MQETDLGLVCPGPGIRGSTLVLAKTLPPPFTPQSKCYTIKIIWFCEEIFKRNAQLHKIDSVGQLGDIFMKGLTHVVFEHL